MKHFTLLSTLLGLACVAIAAPASQAQSNSQASTQIGTLDCFVAEGSGFVVGSSKDISCTLYAMNEEPIENYIGELKKYGVDIGFTKETLLQWAVYVPAGEAYQPGSLSGTYAGASANASLAIGLGANLLIGGLAENLTLQPLEVSKQKGINIAVGITKMELRFIEAYETEAEGQAAQE